MTTDAVQGRVRRAEHVHRWNAAANLALAVAKVLVGLAAGSGALVADGIQSATDLVSNALAFLGHRIAQLPPDEDHHHGHGNAEALAACAVGLVILAGGAGILWRAFTMQGQVEHGALGGAALTTAAVSIGVCWWLAGWTLRAGTELNSPGLIALGRDKRGDSLTSSLVLIGIASSLLGAPWLEAWIAGGIGAYICLLGVRSFRDGLDILMDRVPEPGIQEELLALAQAVPGVVDACCVRVHPLGTSWSVELEITVDGSATVAEGHSLADEVESRITQARDQIVRVQVHVNPA